MKRACSYQRYMIFEELFWYNGRGDACNRWRKVSSKLRRPRVEVFLMSFVGGKALETTVAGKLSAAFFLLDELVLL